MENNLGLIQLQLIIGITCPYVAIKDSSNKTMGLNIIFCPYWQKRIFFFIHILHQLKNSVMLSRQMYSILPRNSDSKFVCIYVCQSHNLKLVYLFNF